MNEILARREQLGLRFALLFNLGLMVFFVAITVAAAQSMFELVSTLIFIALGLGVTVFFLVNSFQGKYITASGWVTTMLYLVIDWALPWIWYQSVGGDVVPRVYFFKVAILPVNFVVLVLCCLPGRPIYPLVFTIGSSLGLAALAIAGLTDPRSVFTTDILSSVQGPGASLPLVIMNDAEYVAAGILLTILLHRFRQTVVEASTAEHSTAQLGRYFSPGLVPLIAQSDASFLKPGGQLQTVTVLFSDIRSFTSISEGMPPERVVELLSLYQEQMVAAIFEEKGTLDKFIGDGIMATFGTPLPSPDDGVRAVRAALAMQRRLVDLNRTLEARGFPTLRHGIGIHSGSVIAGNVGTSARLEYTVIGDTVNTASRVEALCKETGDSLLVSSEVKLAAGEGFRFEPRGVLPIRGKSEPLAVFSVNETLP